MKYPHYFIVLFVWLSLGNADAQNKVVIDSKTADTLGIWNDLVLIGKAFGQNTAEINTHYQAIKLITVHYYGLDNRLHQGLLLVNKELEADFVALFQQIKKSRFPICKVIPANKYGLNPNLNGWDDEKIMLDNATTCFNFRFKTDGKSLSLHAEGRAIDFNPLFNPYEEYKPDGKFVHPQHAFYDLNRKGTVTDANIVHLFDAKGWTWGGRWGNPIDYQHFQKGKTPRPNKMYLIKENAVKDYFAITDTSVSVYATPYNKEHNRAEYCLNKKDKANLEALIRSHSPEKIKEALKGNTTLSPLLQQSGEAQANRFRNVLLVAPAIDTNRLKATLSGCFDQPFLILENTAENRLKVKEKQPALTLVVKKSLNNQSVISLPGAFTEAHLKQEEARLGLLLMLATDVISNGLSVAQKLAPCLLKNQANAPIYWESKDLIASDYQGIVFKYDPDFMGFYGVLIGLEVSNY